MDFSTEDKANGIKFCTAVYQHLKQGMTNFCELCSLGRITVYVFVFCMVMDLSAIDKASGVKFCMAVLRHLRKGISHFWELCSPRSPKSDELASMPLSCDASRLL